MRNPPITVFVDVDSVLLDYPTAFREYMRTTHPSVVFDPFDTYPIEFVSMFQEHSDFARLSPIAGAIEGLRRLRNLRVNVRILTSSVNSARQMDLRCENLSTVFDQGILQQAVLLPSGSDKAEWLTTEYSLAGEEWRYVLIDDHPMHIESWLKTNCHAILLKQGDWSSEKWPISSDVTVAHAWDEVPYLVWAHVVSHS